MPNKYLPVGTVVLLKGGIKKVMITGFCVTKKDDKDKLFDYSACLYPEGVLSINEALLFNHEQIEKIEHLGYSDEEQKQFNKRIIEIVESRNKD